MVYRTPGGIAHPPTDLYVGQILWNKRRKEAWADLAVQRIDSNSPEGAFSAVLRCLSLKDLSYVDNRHWDPQGPKTILEKLFGRSFNMGRAANKNKRKENR